MTLAYASELTLEQFELLQSLLPAAAPTGRPRTVNLMAVVQAIFYGLVSGCAWGLLPDPYPLASTVYDYFRKWRDDGTWKRIYDHLMQWVRVAEQQDASPSAGSLDAQRVPTAVMVNQAVGYDPAKGIKGRKRFTLVDTFGLLKPSRSLLAAPQSAKGQSNCSNRCIRSATGCLAWFEFGSMGASVAKTFWVG